MSSLMLSQAVAVLNLALFNLRNRSRSLGKNAAARLHSSGRG
jgi:hypothetical protein